MFNYGVFTGKNTILMFTDKNAIDKQILIQSLVKNYKHSNLRGWAAAQPFKGSIEPLRLECLSVLLKVSMFMNVQHVVNNDRCTTNPTFSGEQQLLLGGWLFGGLLEGQPQLLKTSLRVAAAAANS